MFSGSTWVGESAHEATCVNSVYYVVQKSSNLYLNALSFYIVIIIIIIIVIVFVVVVVVVVVVVFTTTTTIKEYSNMQLLVYITCVTCTHKEFQTSKNSIIRSVTKQKNDITKTFVIYVVRCTLTYYKYHHHSHFRLRSGPHDKEVLRLCNTLE